MPNEQKKITKVMCFGAFDGLHKGHLSYFKQARKYGDYVIAVIARGDKIIKQNVSNVNWFNFTPLSIFHTLFYSTLFKLF